MHYFVRDLVPADLALIEDGGAAEKPQRLTRLRDSHHRLARLIAAGKTHTDAGAMAGYSVGSIGRLMEDPAFLDLVAVYRKVVKEELEEYVDLATANLIRGERIIGDSLEAASDREEPLSLVELRPVLDIVSERQDRFGYPKQQVNHNVSHDLAGRLEAARKRSGLALPPAKPEAPLVEGVKKEPVAQ
jgi:hypothetical protein